MMIINQLEPVSSMLSELLTRADALANELCENDNDGFWKGVSKINQTSNVIASSIDGISGECNISVFWRDHFSSILNSSGLSNADLKNSIMSKLDDVQYGENMIVSSRVTSKLISEIDSGKSSGPDNISPESLKFASNRLSVLLSLCFSVCLSHGYLPPAMIKTTIVPIVKNKCGNISESNNYRPITLATIISKLFESVLLVKCEDYSNQFGFKKGHITDLCIYALTGYIEYYKNRNTSVFVTMLDASKAFDRVNFWLLFQKLLSRNVPLFIVRILAMWYTHQKICI